MIQNKNLSKFLILMIFFANVVLLSSAVTYYTLFYSENGKKVTTSFSNGQEAQQDKNTCESNLISMINSALFKLVLAFFCGGMISERPFTKLGLI